MDKTQIRRLSAGGQRICVNLWPSVAFQISQFRCALIKWYRRRGRDLPWRRTRDPYRVLVSEFMLQQTQVSRVREYYPRFLERFPDLESLARAKPRTVREAWDGLGYYARARNLHALAKCVAGRGDAERGVADKDVAD